MTGSSFFLRLRLVSASEERAAIDVTTILVNELEKQGRHHDAAGILEDRGFLQEAAKKYDAIANGGDKDFRSLYAKATSLRIRYVELMLLSKNWKTQSDMLLSKLGPITSSNTPSSRLLSIDASYGSILSHAIITKSALNPFKSFSTFKDSIMWQFRSFKIAIDSMSKEEILQSMVDLDPIDCLSSVLDLALKMKELGNALRRKDNRNSEEDVLVSNAEGYFDLLPKKLSPNQLTTNPIINLRLREVTCSEKCPLPLAHGGMSLQSGFIQVLDRDKTHLMLSKFMYSNAASLMMFLSDLMTLLEKKTIPTNSCSLEDVRQFVDYLQMHLKCAKNMSALYRGDSNRGLSKTEPWISLEKKREESELFAAQKLQEILFLKSRLPFSVDGDAGSKGTKSIKIQSHSIHALKKYSSNHFSKLHMTDKKRDITHTIANWRVQALCEQYESAYGSVDKEIRRLEKHGSTTNDYKKGRSYYFINKKRDIFPRMWLWVIGSAHSDIMNSVLVQERIIKTSLEKKGLTPLTKSDQVSMLEANAVALFAALSLTYSEVKSPPLWIRRSCIQKLLAGEPGLPQLHGFGVALNHVLLSYCDKHCFEVFEKVLLHLENAAGMILIGNLLSPEGEDIGRFEAALYLSAFICFNAVSFSTAGNDMNILDYKRDNLASLPSLPLQGNIKKLTAELRHALQSAAISSEIKQFFSPIPASFADLANSMDLFLRNTADDGFIFCFLRQQDDEVDVCAFQEFGNFVDLFPGVNIEFNETSNRFEQWSESTSFLERIVRIDANAAEEEQGRVFEEQDARRKIAHFIKEKSLRKNTHNNWRHAQGHFRCWKRVLENFVSVVKRRMTERKTCGNANDTGDGSASDDQILFVFDSIINTLDDWTEISQQRDEAKRMFSNAIIDGIECTYCGIVHDENVQVERYRQWHYDGKRMPFRSFVMAYNQMHFGDAYVAHPGYFDHVNAPFHKDNVACYSTHLNDMTTIFARLKMSIDLVMQIICRCDEEGQKGNEHASWYLSTAEHGRELLSRLESALKELVDAVFAWTYQPSNKLIFSIMQRISSMPQLAATYFEQNKLEELKKKESTNAAEADTQSSERHGSIESVIELTRGPYLNPEASAFVPMHY